MSGKAKDSELAPIVDEAGNKIDLWRGQCLNLFARAEAAVGAALQTAIERGQTVKLRHLAGQRLADLEDFSSKLDGTTKQKAALADALEKWRELEERRGFLAHGCVAATVERRGEWIAVFDMVEYRGNKGKQLRWTIKEGEAEAYLDSLTNGFAKFSSQLGQLRKRIAPKSQ